MLASSICHNVINSFFKKEERKKMIKKASNILKKKTAENGFDEGMIYYGNMVINKLLNKDCIDDALKFSKIAVDNQTVGEIINYGILLLMKDQTDTNNIKMALVYLKKAVDYKDDSALFMYNLLNEWAKIPKTIKLTKDFYEGFGCELYDIK